jgi:hypothetical protein
MGMTVRVRTAATPVRLPPQRPSQQTQNLCRVLHLQRHTVNQCQALQT